MKKFYIYLKTPLSDSIKTIIADSGRFSIKENIIEVEYPERTLFIPMENVVLFESFDQNTSPIID